MKIFAYRVQQKGPRTFSAVINSLHALALDQRHLGAASDIRLEERQVRAGILYMDFAKSRGGHGPGRMSRNRPLQVIRLNADEAFGEDTAVAYHLETGCAAVQYNHHGPPCFCDREVPFCL